MDAGAIDLKTNFGQDRRHVVPLCQRHYISYGKTQWEPLWANKERVRYRHPMNRTLRRLSTCPLTAVIHARISQSE
jgi:hypothetical protein